ncbi:hypothetical protein RQP46_005538 [Phenoliferia psychrophenolica]
MGSSFVGELATPFLALFAVFWVWRQVTGARPSSSSKSVAIVVLGDIGRSPRMLYHAQSFLSHGYTTHIVAYRGAALPKELTEASHVHLVYLPTPLAFVSALPRPLFLLLAPLKVLHATASLFWALAFRIEHAPAFMLVQNPPAIPTLPVVKFAAVLRGSKILIDWHNTGYSVLAMRLGTRHPVVKLAKWIETYWGRTAFAHLCVTEAMKTKLQTEAGIRGRAVVFHDRPPAHFHRLTSFDAHALFSRLDVISSPSLSSFFLPNSFSSTSTPFTTITSPTTADPLPTRPALLVSATSWTADEDFSILLAALSIYDEAVSALATKASGSTSKEQEIGGRAAAVKAERLPKVLVVITGKGAMKADFEAQVREKEKAGGWEHVRVRTAWLAIEDYPKLLGSADLGISLHASTSGADLPMKVVDMFGCGLPVCALDFPCISELVQDGVNGRVFRTAEDLADQLVSDGIASEQCPNLRDFQLLSASASD